MGPFFEEEASCIIGYNPVFSESNWAGDDRMILMINATDAKRVLGFVLCTVWYFIVKGTETTRAVSIRFFCMVCCQVTENLCQWLP